ncbi:MAG: hypothetical protein A2W01_10750 [Candidatus Solincola sediminis]|uniref:Uncharacterized protein n=1 Tax=Candidatus Solincola sediminis TaxID=1797199 RepID=A0A1F2WMF3_9ACTN|nr:MAG: hypothetical protein A2Y75_12305 [Candidatus Solincola sediminis]OFW61381.1 MAG: hypothetical protein A2W01_10750 [Candidatus Solincola sediminis]
MRYCIIGLVVVSLMLLVAGCGGNSAEQLTNPTEGPIAQADSAACAANRKVIGSSIQQYSAIEGNPATSLQQLVPKYLQSIPACPGGGSYSLQGGSVYCSIHGS